MSLHKITNILMKISLKHLNLTLLYSSYPLCNLKIRKWKLYIIYTYVHENVYMIICGSQNIYLILVRGTSNNGLTWLDN